MPMAVGDLPTLDISTKERQVRRVLAGFIASRVCQRNQGCIRSSFPGPASAQAAEAAKANYGWEG